MAEYDPNIIQEYADRLYAKAIGVQILATLIGLVVPWGVLGASRVVTSEAAIIAGLLGALIGFAIGRAMGFGYKLQAQTALCQAQIEKNTRTAEKSAAAGA